MRCSNGYSMLANDFGKFKKSSGRVEKYDDDLLFTETNTVFLLLDIPQ
jgi:hypothetical protein